MSGILSEALLGLTIAAAFDWVTLYAANIGRLESKRLRRQAALSAFALHGPFFALALPLWVNGRLATALSDRGVVPEISPILAMAIVGLLTALLFWAIGRLPMVANAKAAVAAAPVASAGTWKQWFGVSK